MHSMFVQFSIFFYSDPRLEFLSEAAIEARASRYNWDPINWWSLLTLRYHIAWIYEAFQGDLNWALMTPKAESLSVGCAPDCCRNLNFWTSWQIWSQFKMLPCACNTWKLVSLFLSMFVVCFCQCLWSILWMCLERITKASFFGVLMVSICMMN